MRKILALSLIFALVPAIPRAQSAPDTIPAQKIARFSVPDTRSIHGIQWAADVLLEAGTIADRAVAEQLEDAICIYGSVADDALIVQYARRPIAYGQRTATRVDVYCPINAWFLGVLHAHTDTLLLLEHLEGDRRLLAADDLSLAGAVVTPRLLVWYTRQLVTWPPWPYRDETCAFLQARGLPCTRGQ